MTCTDALMSCCHGGQRTTNEKPSNVLLSHGNSHTTIGANAFHFWVRDGIRWYYVAIVARQKLLLVSLMMSALSRRCAAHVLRTLRCYLLKALTSSRYTTQKRLNIPNDKLIIMESVYKYSFYLLFNTFMYVTCTDTLMSIMFMDERFYRRRVLLHFCQTSYNAS